MAGKNRTKSGSKMEIYGREIFTFVVTTLHLRSSREHIKLVVERCTL